MRALLQTAALVGLSLNISLPAIPRLAEAAPSQNLALGPEAQLLARGGGRGGGGRIGGGGRSSGGFSGGSRNYGRSGSSTRSSSAGRTGFGSYSNGGSAYRGSSRPTGGFSSGNKPTAGRQQTRQSTAGERQGQRTERTNSRQENRTERSGNRQDQRTDRSTNRQEQRSDRVSDRSDVRRNRADNRWDNNWAGWARPGWGYARPWNYGWYGGGNAWPWWGVGVGFGALATAAVINDAVDDAISTQVTYITVPETSYSLYYSSIEPLNEDTVTFAVNTGSGVVEMRADCRQGTLNDEVPRTQAEAQLLNAACEVAFGKG